MSCNRRYEDVTFLQVPFFLSFAQPSPDVRLVAGRARAPARSSSRIPQLVTPLFLSSRRLISHPADLGQTLDLKLLVGPHQSSSLYGPRCIVVRRLWVISRVATDGENLHYVLLLASTWPDSWSENTISSIVVDLKL